MSLNDSVIVPSPFYGADLTVMVHCPMACVLKLSVPLAPVTSHDPEPLDAISFGRQIESAPELVSDIEKFVPPPIVGSVLPE